MKFLNDYAEEQLEAEARYDFLCDQVWNNMSKEAQMMAFYSVCKRIYKGDVLESGSYRYVLYDVFGFDPESYGMGMQCGYMAIHNAIVDKEELDRLRKENLQLKKEKHNVQD